MKHAGHARRAALKLIFLTLVGVIVVGSALAGLRFLPAALGSTLIALWVLFVLFTLYFFRDPAARTPAGPGLVVSPGHGKVDCIQQLDDSVYMGGPCHRISI